jgi:hypothetical protein
MLQHISECGIEAILAQGISRMEIKPGGSRSLVKLDTRAQIPKIAGVLATDSLRINEDPWFGIPAKVVEVLDAASKLAAAAGIQALRNAGIALEKPADSTPRDPKCGKLPASMQEETGIIFASAFPTMDSTLQYAESKSNFDRKLLLRLLCPGT